MRAFWSLFCCSRVLGLGFGVFCLGFRVWDWGFFRVWGLGFRLVEHEAGRGSGLDSGPSG